jgi:diaminohydroxyphosphoribosylaminopyrimidine deaminase / 5-amino-6-(5-phosphoribosylamino)uracil reductase
MATDTGADDRWMALALEEAAKARGRTSPNPMVGAVVVRDGDLVALGHHRKAGSPHAEIVALDVAEDRARGADLYVTLEPCSHTGRTPPCAERIVQTGVRRVICAHVDPDPRVSGQGIAMLEAAGIEVTVGVGEAESRRLNEQYLWWQKHQRPWVTMKWAQTIDGRIATHNGQSRWITGHEARAHAHRIRSWHDAVLVGVGTVLQDDPQLNVRMVDGRQPRKVVLDSHLRTPVSAAVFESSDVIVVCSAGADSAKRQALEHRGAEIVALEQTPHDLAAVLEALAARDIRSVMVEGGSEVVTSFIRAGLANRIGVFVAPRILGAGTDAVGELGADCVEAAMGLDETEIEQFGDDWFITGVVATTGVVAMIGVVAETSCSPGS